MAEKRPKSILSGLKNMLHRDAGKPSDPAPKKASASARKKTAERPADKRPAPEERPRQPQAAPATAESASPSGAAAEEKHDKKRIPNQPWYRHRQRW